MRKSLILVGMLVAVCASAQQIGDSRSRVTEGKASSRVGINTNKPVATLEVSKIASPYANQVEGFMLPHLTQAERNNMKKEDLTNGLQIFNIDKNCIDWWNGSTWQCTDGSIKDNHGDEAKARSTKQWWSDTDITVYKNNCPAGQQAKSDAKIVISYTQPNPNPPIVGEGTAVGLTQGDADDKALEAAKADFYRKAQDYVNGQFGSSYCEAIPTKDPDKPVVTTGTGDFTMENRAYWFSSIDDDDYLPLPTTPRTGPATLEKLPADGVASGYDANDLTLAKREPAILKLGKIPPLANAITVYIPIKLTSGSTLSLSEHIHHIDIPAEYTSTGRAGVATFTWNPVELNSSTRYIPAKFYAQGGEGIELKGLDLIGGLGEDQLGMVIGTFKYPKSKAETTIDQMTGKYELRLISGILDKNFSHKSKLADVEDYRHRFIYVPVQGPDGKIWFGNNLGANYANLYHTAFMPGQQAKNATDYHAYGSLGQWSRPFNGRELMTWTSSTSGTPTFKDEPGYNWTSDESSLLTSWTSASENCPTGWHTPTYTSFQEHITAMNSTITYPTGTSSSNMLQNIGYHQHGLRVPLSGFRYHDSGSSFYNVGSLFHWWSSTPYSSSYAYNFNGNTGGVYTSDNNRSYGFAFRCLKD